MQLNQIRAIEGYVEDGLFHPLNEMERTPVKARAFLTILEEEPMEVQRQNLNDWLQRLNAARAEAVNEPWAYEVQRQPMKPPINFGEL